MNVSNFKALIAALICTIVLCCQPNLFAQQPQQHLTLLAPIGGEVYRPTDVVPIIWIGNDPLDPVTIEFSPNDGRTWKPVAQNVTGGRYLWHVPFSLTKRARIRISSQKPGVPTGTILQSFMAHSRNANCAEFSPDGKFLATVGADYKVKLWDVQTGTLLKTMSGHTYYVHRLSFSLNGKMLATGGYDGKAIVWDLATGSMIRSFQGSGGTTVKFRPDNTTLVIGSNDGELILLNVMTGAEIIRFRGHQGEIRHMSISPDGQNVLTACADRTAGVFNLNNGTRVHSLGGFTSTVNGVDITKDGKYIIAGSYDRSIRIFDANTGAVLKTLTVQSAEVSEIKVNPDNKSFISASYDGTAKIIDIQSGQILQTLLGNSYGYDIGANFSYDGSKAVTTYLNGTVVIWSLKSDPFTTCITGDKFTISFCITRDDIHNDIIENDQPDIETAPDTNINFN